MTLRIIEPFAITQANIDATNVTLETAWTAGTYTLGQVRRVGERLFEVSAASTTQEPGLPASTQWFDAGPANRYAAFDLQFGADQFRVIDTVTTRADSIAFTLSGLPRLSAMAFFGLACTQIDIASEIPGGPLRLHGDFPTAGIDQSTSSTAMDAEGPFRPMVVGATASVTSADRRSNAFSVASGVPVFCRARIRAGSSGKYRIACINGSAATTSFYDGTFPNFSGVATSSAAGTLTDFIRTTVENGDTEITFTWTPNATTALARVGIGPFTSVIGETIIAVGMQATDAFADWILGGTGTRRAGTYITHLLPDATQYESSFWRWFFLPQSLDRTYANFDINIPAGAVVDLTLTNTGSTVAVSTIAMGAAGQFGVVEVGSTRGLRSRSVKKTEGTLTSLNRRTPASRVGYRVHLDNYTASPFWRIIDDLDGVAAVFAGPDDNEEFLAYGFVTSCQTVSNVHGITKVQLEVETL